MTNSHIATYNKLINARASNECCELSARARELPETSLLLASQAHFGSRAVSLAFSASAFSSFSVNSVTCVRRRETSGCTKRTL